MLGIIRTMRTILSLFTSALILFGALDLAAAETNAEAIINTHNKEMSAAMRSFAESRGQSWMTNYYGKTLSSLGEIDTIRIIDHTTRTTPNWTHRDLWKIIEESKVQDYPEGSVMFWVPPVFAIEYLGGLRVQADRYNIMIFLPDGRKGSAFLESKP